MKLNSDKISICIPTWEQNKYGKLYLKELLNSILVQTNKNFNIIISDHSINDDISNLVNSFKKKLNISYIRNDENIGNSPSNTNNAINHADGEIIKIMFQDDFFYDKNAIDIILNEFKNNDCIWLANGCNHYYEKTKNFGNYMIPKWNDKILLGINTISSPSVISFRRNSKIFFDENLKMLMDCEFYYQMYLKFGKPKILNNCLITNRIHINQISYLYQDNINDEINYAVKKHKYKYE